MELNITNGTSCGGASCTDAEGHCGGIDSGEPLGEQMKRLY